MSGIRTKHAAPVSPPVATAASLPSHHLNAWFKGGVGHVISRLDAISLLEWVKNDMWAAAGSPTPEGAANLARQQIQVTQLLTKLSSMQEPDVSPDTLFKALPFAGWQDVHAAIENVYPGNTPGRSTTLKNIVTWCAQLAAGPDDAFIPPKLCSIDIGEAQRILNEAKVLRTGQNDQVSAVHFENAARELSSDLGTRPVTLNNLRGGPQRLFESLKWVVRDLDKVAHDAGTGFQSSRASAWEFKSLTELLATALHENGTPVPPPPQQTPVAHRPGFVSTSAPATGGSGGGIISRNPGKFALGAGLIFMPHLTVPALILWAIGKGVAHRS